MKRALIGLVAGFTLAGAGMSARAQDTNSMGGSTMKHDTSKMGMGEAMTNELSGKVVKAEMNTVWVEYSGAVIPLKVDANTHFEGANLKKAKDLKEGEEIRASFTVKNRTDNLAKTISLSSPTGGSGLENQPSESNPNPKTY